MDYYRPTELDAGLRWLEDQPAARVAAGCTDLFPATEAAGLTGPVLDVTAIDGLRGISEGDEGWRFGATTTWTDVIRADLPPAFDGLKLAAHEVGSVQIQNAGTVAGNLCNASPAADGMPCWLTLDALVELRSASGRRVLPISEFVVGPRQTVREQGELVTAILVPRHAGHGRSAFLKLGARKYLVISIAMVAVRLEGDAGRVSTARVAVGSCSPVARRIVAAERALEEGRHLTDDCVATALAPIDDIRADAAYRTEAAPELVRRAVAMALHEGAAP